MVDYGLTVKGLFTLAGDYELDAITLHNGGSFKSVGDEMTYRILRDAAARCRSKAYDLLGVVTLNADSRSTQRALDEVQL